MRYRLEKGDRLREDITDVLNDEDVPFEIKETVRRKAEEE